MAKWYECRECKKLFKSEQGRAVHWGKAHREMDEIELDGPKFPRFDPEPIAEAPVAGVEDFVNHPPHYTAGGVECIDAIRASMSGDQFRGYVKGCVMKYLWRWERKGGVEDLQKAEWYLKELIRATGEVEK